MDHGIRLVRRSGAVQVVLHGEHDVFTAASLRQRLHRALSEQLGCVVDLSGCTALDSTVLAVLLGAARRAGEQGLPFVLVIDPAPDGPVRRVFDLAGLGSSFPVYDDADEAIEAIGAPRG